MVARVHDRLARSGARYSQGTDRVARAAGNTERREMGKTRDAIDRSWKAHRGIGDRIFPPTREDIYILADAIDALDARFEAPEGGGPRRWHQEIWDEIDKHAARLAANAKSIALADVWHERDLRSYGQACDEATIAMDQAGRERDTAQARLEAVRKRVRRENPEAPTAQLRECARRNKGVFGEWQLLCADLLNILDGEGS